MIFPSQLSDELESAPWDVAVIGAGPGGSVTAREAARTGLRTILIEARAFPRAKVCGSCLNSRALQVLDSVGLGSLMEEIGAVPIAGMELRIDGRSAFLPLPEGRSVTRQRLDAALLESATVAGVRVLTEVSATVEPACESGFRRITLQGHDRAASIQSRIVVCADGLLRSSLRKLSGMGPCPSPGSRIGIGCILHRDQLTEEQAAQFPLKQITMVVGTSGYVGLSWAEANQLSIAAAVDPAAVRTAGSPVELVLKILATNQIQLPVIEGSWHGTSALTTDPRLNATERLFVIGDAAGYVEPFTGEGMAAAIEQSVAVMPLVAAGVRDWRAELAEQWQSYHHSVFRQRQRVCRMSSAILKRRWLSKTAFHLLRTFPRMARIFVDSVNRPSRTVPHLDIEHV